jgi:DNA-binding NarL/FixJ family response regulator
MTPKRDTNLPSIDETTLWIVEDDDLFRTAIAGFINASKSMRCEKMFSSCEDLLRTLKTEHAPEIILMDIGLPGMNGIEGVRPIKEISPATDIIILTIHEEDNKVFQAICAGASGYLLKSSTGEEIVASIKEVVRGGAPMNAQIARKVLDMFTRFATPRGDYGLTEREKDILREMIDGHTKKVIAERLFLSYHTIDTHIKNIYQKLHVHSQGGAVAKALKENLLK